MFADLQKLPINPRIMSCFGDEDFVRRLCSIDSWLKLRDIIWSITSIKITVLYVNLTDLRLVGAMLRLYIPQR